MENIKLNKRKTYSIRFRPNIKGILDVLSAGEGMSRGFYIELLIQSEYQKKLRAIMKDHECTLKEAEGIFAAMGI